MLFSEPEIINYQQKNSKITTKEDNNGKITAVIRSITLLFSCIYKIKDNYLKKDVI